MTPRTRRLALLAPLTLALLAPPGARPAAPPRPRTDRYGDPLPPGAVARLGTVRFRHAALIDSVAFSPDGKTLAFGGVWSDGSGDSAVIHLYDWAAGKELRTIRDRDRGRW